MIHDDEIAERIYRTDYTVRCATPDCHEPVSLPEWDVYCSTCIAEQRKRVEAFQARANVKAAIERRPA